jgi:predicted heme/steroid binding protein/uncharacterized membrane protein
MKNGGIMEKYMNEDELQNNNGQDGRPAYVAFRGKVYDVSGSKLWLEGIHQHRHQAGKDLTADFAAAPHDESVLQRVPNVGIVISTEREEMHPWLSFYLDLHAHPISVHFPTALTITTAGFIILYLLTGIRGLVDSAYYTLSASVIIAPIAILTGTISWWYNYRHKMTLIFKGKSILAITLFIVEIATIALWSINRDALYDREAIGWLYFAFVMVMCVLVVSLGKLGGELVFPSKTNRRK